MNKQTLVKTAVKLTLGLGVSAIIGSTIKAETKVQDALDAFFESRSNK